MAKHAHKALVRERELQARKPPLAQVTLLVKVPVNMAGIRQARFGYSAFRVEGASRTRPVRFCGLALDIC
jgi:hypothetical protein